MNASPKRLLVLPCQAFRFRIVLQPRTRPRPPGRSVTMRCRVPRRPDPRPRSTPRPHQP